MVKFILILISAIMVVACGGDPFVYVEETAIAINTDSGRLPTEVGTTVPQPLLDAAPLPDTISLPDTGSAPVTQKPEASTVKEPVEASTQDAPACEPVPSATFGCGPPILVNLPSQYCVLNISPDTAQALPMPPSCSCNYTCECLQASGATLCPSGETFTSCSIGTTGGVVVECSGPSTVDAGPDANDTTVVYGGGSSGGGGYLQHFCDNDGGQPTGMSVMCNGASVTAPQFEILSSDGTSCSSTRDDFCNCEDSYTCDCLKSYGSGLCSGGTWACTKTNGLIVVQCQ
jgi:hypothetical protein